MTHHFNFIMCNGGMKKKFDEAGFHDVKIRRFSAGIAVLLTGVNV